MLDEILNRLDVQQLATEGVTLAISFIPDLVVAVAILIGFWVLYRLSSMALRSVLHRSGLHDTLVHMIVDNLYRYVVLGFGVIMAASQVGINVAAALAGIGVVGIAVGFAAQDTLSNIIAGFLIFFDKPFQVGDWVNVADLSGEVSEITMRTTRLRTRNNTWVVIPNKKIIDEVLVNHSSKGSTRVDTPVGIAYKEYIPEAREVLLRAIKGLDYVLENPAPTVVVTALGGSSVDLEVRVWTNNAEQEQPIICAVTEAAKLALDEAGIEIPFPHLQLFVDEVKEPVWASAAKFRGQAQTEARQ